MGEFMERLHHEHKLAEEMERKLAVELASVSAEVKAELVRTARPIRSQLVDSIYSPAGDEMNQALFLVKNEPTDAELAESLKARMREALEPVRKILEEGTAHGMTVQFNIALMPPNPKWQITGISVVKHL